MAIVFGDWLPVPEAQCRLPNELTYAVGRWMKISEALRRLGLVFGAKAKTKAKSELLNLMHGGGLLTALRCTRLRDGHVIGFPVTQYPVPSYWGAASPESLGNGVWQICEGEESRIVILCEGYVDFQSFNEWLGALTKAAEKKPGRINWDDFWNFEKERKRRSLLPSPKAYMKEAPTLVRDRYGVTSVNLIYLRLFKAALYRGDKERPKPWRKK